MLIPKLATTLKDYTRRQFVSDLTAGLIVGVAMSWRQSSAACRRLGRLHGQPRTSKPADKPVTGIVHALTVRLITLPEAAGSW